MTVHQAFRYELDPTGRQRRLLAPAAGTARCCFHWGLAWCKRLLHGGKPVPHAAAMHRLWNAERPQRSGVYGAAKCGGQEALRQVDRACANFWRGRTAGQRVGFAPFRRQHGRRDSFRLTGSIPVHARSVGLPRIGCVRTKETTENVDGRSLSATVRREADRWYASLTVEVERDDPQPADGPVVGIDMGLQCFAVPSAGARIEAPKPLAQAQPSLRHRQGLHGRQEPGSRSRRTSAVGRARLHRSICCRRADFLHKAATDLAKAQPVVVVEDLRGMIRNHCLARSMADAGWGECRRMLAYTTQRYGSRLVVAPRFYPSTKTCSARGAIQDGMSLSERVFRCGAEIDRDLPAARNLASLVAGSSPETQHACGADGSGQGNGPANPAASKQESPSRPLAASAVRHRRL